MEETVRQAAAVFGPEVDAPGWARALRARLDTAPDPETARRLAADVLAGVDPAALAERAAASGGAEALAALLGAVCGVAPFLSRFLRSHPEWLLELLADDLSLARRREDLTQRLDAALRHAGDDDASLVLRRFKYFELTRLTARDCAAQWVPLEHSGTTLGEISQLADVLLDRALRIARARVRDARGPACWTGAAGESVALGFCVLGLGKLGGEELNYSSDVDVVYVYEAPSGPLRDGPGDLSPPEYFTRVAREFGTLVNDTGAEGFLYRVDVELRPEGASGALVVSDEVLAGYYEVRAAAWEKAAFMKARPVAGDSKLGWRAIRAVDPMIYASSMDYSAVQDIRMLKEKVALVHAPDNSAGAAAESEGGDMNPAGFNVKLGPGGIRDVEYLAQSLQLLYGGRVPQLRNRSTQQAIRSLADAGLLPAERATQLDDAYLFLRRVENRLQMEAERQTHVLPGDAEGLQRLALAFGLQDREDASALEQFEPSLTSHRQEVLDLISRAVSPDGSARIFQLFAHNVPRLTDFPTSRRMIETLAEHFAREIDASADPQRALNNLDRFISGAGARRFYYELLLDRPELVRRLASLFGASNYLSATLARHPVLIESLFHDPATLLLTLDQLREDMASLMRDADGSSGSEGRSAGEAQLDALRRFCHRQVLNVGLLDIDNAISREEAEGALTQIAEVCIEESLAFARRALAERYRGGGSLQEADVRGFRFLVVGMGKLASRALSYGSDLDLIFLFDSEDPSASTRLEAQAYTVKLAQRFISALQTRTAEGFCYEIDARLRPSGNQGALVVSLDSFRRYHGLAGEAPPGGGADVWERQALLRSRSIAGDEKLALAFLAARSEILCQPTPDDLASQIHHVRLRMEHEIAKETGQRRDFKTGRGGLLDVESVVQCLQLQHGQQYRDLLVPHRMERHLATLRENALIAQDDAAILLAGWNFLQRLGSRLRIVENRSISDLDEERGDLDGLAIRLGYDTPRFAGGARRELLRDYRAHTEAVRRVYVRLFEGTEGIEASGAERSDDDGEPG